MGTIRHHKKNHQRNQPTQDNLTRTLHTRRSMHTLPVSTALFQGRALDFLVKIVLYLIDRGNLDIAIIDFNISPCPS